MYKVLIVDDEILVRIGLKSMADFENFGFSVVGEASNGEGGWEKFLAFSPDVVFTDIKMPKKDGFWLIEKIREENPKVPIVVLTCYDEFSYVREALKLKVFDYVLKAEMEESQIEELLVRIKENLDKTSITNEKDDEDLTLRRDNIIGMILDERKSDEEVEETIHKEYSDISNAKYEVCVFDFSNSLNDDKYESEQIVNILTAVKELIASRFSDAGVGITIKQFGISLTCFLICEDLSETKIKNIVISLEEAVKSYFDTPFMAAIGKVHSDIRSVRDGMDWINFASDRMFYNNKSYVQTEGETKHGEGKAEYDRKQFVRDIIESIDKKDSVKVEALVDNLMEGISNLGISTIDGKLKMVHCMDDIIKQYTEVGANLEGANVFQKGIIEAGHISGARLLFLEFTRAIQKGATYLQLNSKEMIIVEAKKYIEEHYTEKLSLDEVADYCGISKYYFSNLFKQICGINFVGYVSNVRIENAKIILKDQKLSVLEVSEMVGFSDSQYFSKTFKKHTGYTVSEYRNKISDR